MNAYTDDQGITWVPTHRLAMHCDPFRGCWPELDHPITLEEVEACLRAGNEAEHKPFDFMSMGRVPAHVMRAKHVQKIAWFARHGFQKPLSVDVGVPGLGIYSRWFVQDGNHRLAAAIFRMRMLDENPQLPTHFGGSLVYGKQLGLYEDKQ